METNATGSVAGAAGGFRGFRQATRTVLDMLETEIQGSGLFVAHLDDEFNQMTIVDAVGDASFGLESGLVIPLDESFCVRMAADIAPRLCNDAEGDAVYRDAQSRVDLRIGSYVGVPLELDDGVRAGSLCALAHDPHQFSDRDQKLLEVMAWLLSNELDREYRERNLTDANDALRLVAREDHLTGLLNRRAFDEVLRREWARCKRDLSQALLVVADVDGLKRVNDTQGHAAGDELICTVGAALQAAVREGDWVARTGGDEFAVLLAGAESVGDGRSYCRRVERLLDASSGHPEASFGIAVLSVSESPEDALEVADSVMYESRAERRWSTGFDAS